MLFLFNLTVRSLFSFVCLSVFFFLSNHTLLFMFFFVAGLTSVSAAVSAYY